ncbi:MAG: hypothetical protein ACNA8W_03185 [Bradymonadaceae bacterium]
MDNAVAIVQAYLNVNGYFTVVEYPILEGSPHGRWRSATDLDVLALRFPGAGRSANGNKGSAMRGNLAFEPDPILGAPMDLPDMIVGEVKEGLARFNPAARNPEVLATALARIGCCDLEEAAAITQKLLHNGQVETRHGHRIRMVAFGSRIDESDQLAERVISMGHMVGFLRDYLSEHWDALGQTQLKGDALGFLALLEKAERGSTA